MKKIILPALMLAVLSSGALRAQTKTESKKVQPAAKPAAGKNTLPPPMKAPASPAHAMPLPKPGGTQQVKPATMPTPAAKPATAVKPAAPAKPMPAAKPATAKAAPAAKKHTTAAKKHAAPKKKAAKMEEVVMPTPPPPMPIITEPTVPVDVTVNKVAERKENRSERESSYAHHGHSHGDDFDYCTRRAWRQQYRQKRREMRWKHHTHCGSCCNGKY